MNKLLSYMTLFAVAAVPLGALAAFNHDLLFGMRDSAEVRDLQDFLRNRGLYEGPVNGNFFSITRQAVIAFQEKEGISPSAGYFGPRTRERANTLMGALPSSREAQIDFLQAQIKALQKQIEDLIAKQQMASPSPTPSSAGGPTPTPSPIPPPSPTPEPTPMPTAVPTATPTPTPVSQLLISGSSTQPFPDQGNIPTKIGNITISNTTDHDILFSKFQLDIYDGMDSPLNRGKTILIKLRDGTTTYDTLISKTDFEVNNDPPSPGGTIRRQLDVSFPIIVKSGKTHISSMWLESFDYVAGGTLRINLLTPYVSDGVTPKGTFAFTLTR